MNIKKLASTLLITTFIVPNLFAEPCVNCIAIGFKKDTQNLNKPSFSNTSYDVEDIIPLDDNTELVQDESDYIMPVEENIDIVTEDVEEAIVLIDNSETNINEMNLIYACDDNEAPVLMCDTVTQECECV